jgi:single-strand DNA-binding protein
MAYLNKVFLIGNLTRDPELRMTPKGTAICQFGIAVNRQFKDESGATRDETTFVDIEAWGKQGELVAKYLNKGSLAMVEGRLKFDQWEDKTSGQKRSKLKVVLDNVQFLSTRGSASGAGGGQPAGAGDEADPAASDRPAPRAGGRPEAPGGPPKGDEDVPF